MRRQC